MEGRSACHPGGLGVIPAFVIALLLASALGAAFAPRAAGAIVKPPIFEYLAAGDAAGPDSMSALAVDADGTLYACGTVWHETTGYDITVTRFGDGDSGWTVTWDSAAEEDDRAVDIACGEDDTIYIYGSQGGGLEQKPVLLKYGPDGGLRWRIWEASDDARHIVSGKTGIYTCSVDHDEDTGRPFLRVVKYLPHGAVAWDASYRVRGYKTETYPGGLWVSRAGNVYVAGAADGVDFVRKAFVVSWTDGGARRWAKVYNGPGRANAAFSAIAPCPRGGVYTAGYATSDARDLLLVRYAANGERTLTRRLGVGDGHAQWATDVAVDSRGRVALCGGWRVSNRGYYVALLRADGAVVWAHNYAGDKTYGYAKHVAVDSLDRVCVTGNGRGSLAGSSYASGAVATYAFSRAGALRWSSKWPAALPPAAAVERPTPFDIAVLGSSNVWVCGSTELRAVTGVDQFVIGWGL